MVRQSKAAAVKPAGPQKEVEKSRVILDLDGTLTVDDVTPVLADGRRDYAKMPVNRAVAAAVKTARAQGYPVTVFSARNMRTFKGDLALIEKHTKPVAEAWLAANGIAVDGVQLGKPWAGPHGMYVDDKGLSPEEFVFKFTGPFSGQTVDVVVPFYNEENNVGHTHGLMQRLERLVTIGRYIYVENGSKDKTRAALTALARQDAKILVVPIDVNKGYGYGMKAGMAAATGDIVMTNHADGQFDGYTYLLPHLAALQQRKPGVSLLSVRLNRPRYDAFRTWVLQLAVGLFDGGFRQGWVGDFNGQPKIFPRAALGKNPAQTLAQLPDDFCIDLALYLLLRQGPHHWLPILQQPRHQGVSSWMGQWRRQVRLIGRYLRYAAMQRG